MQIWLAQTCFAQCQFAVALFKILCNTVRTYSTFEMTKEQKQLLGSRLKAARKEAEASQEFVAETLGVTRQSVSAWETGASCPSALQLGQLAAMYCVCAHKLLFGEPFQPVRLDNYLGGGRFATAKI
ncbi:helix-turn-helix transcriptional regulator [Comamonas odontotermitis]|uniref:helix-turn-helix transcriptional regulator n=1 Tax=Comamonas odontotermitis TaxID=379895 RepID=UPI001CC67583|nr:helix-turn-helix transcriptional regulator [Comamonas odontotermitis]UBB16159.1 helix-turn-helix domain-containing protein [Comamonas odontotermitis]